MLKATSTQVKLSKAMLKMVKERLNMHMMVLTIEETLRTIWEKAEEN